MLIALLLALSPSATADNWATWAAGLPRPEHPEPAYHYANDVWHELAPLVVAHPDVVQPFVVGHTTTDQPIWGFRVSPPREGRPDVADRPPRKLLVFANIHALEWIPTEVAVGWLKEAVASPPPGVALTVIPILNPDGRARVEADLLAGRNVYRRGNQRQVDLNRDFAVNRTPRAIWASLLPRRYGSSPSPLSQPESRALDALAAAERYDVAISLHAFGGFLYYPWSGRWGRPPDYDTYQALGLRMQQAMGAHAYKPRQLSRWAFFFRAQGTELDHLYGQYGTLSYLVETTRSGLSPLRPSEWKNHFRLYNPHDPTPHVTRCVAMLRELTAAMGETDFVGSRGVPALPPQAARDGGPARVPPAP